MRTEFRPIVSHSTSLRPELTPLLALLLFGGSMLNAQPTAAVFGRVVMIEGKQRATAFAIDVDGRQYWITAKHVISSETGVELRNSTSVRLLEPGSHVWRKVEYDVVDPGPGIDIAVLVVQRIAVRSASPEVGDDRVSLGQDCYFLGFPFGEGFLAKFAAERRFILPFVKRCIFSALLDEKDNRVWILDGINNAGFSGGPVVFSHPDGRQRIAAVISGYRAENRPVVEAGRPSTGNVSVNTGLIIAHSIEHALTAIRRRPIGPKLATPDGAPK